MQDGFTFGHEFLGEGCSVAIGPAGTDGVVVDDGESFEHSRSYQCWAPDSRAGQGSTEWFADGVGEDGCVGWDWVPVEVLADDWHQPAWYRHGTSASTAFWVRLERRVAADLDHGADHRQMGALEIQCVQPQARGFTPAQPCTGGRGDDRAVPVGCCGEKLAAQILTADDLVGGVVSATPGEPDALAGVERDEPVADC